MPLTRRQAVKAIATIPLVKLLGCSSDASRGGAGVDAGSGRDAGSTGDAGGDGSIADAGGDAGADMTGDGPDADAADGGSTADAGGDGSSADAGADAAGDAADGGCGPAAAAWASGGTAAMTARACYPDPFASGVPSCALMCETTQGPCTSTTIEREDVSEGVTGLPVRLALLVVNESCAPVAGARVEIWHTQRTGVYSGVTPSPMMCSGGDPDAVNHLYFRGSQTAGSDGRVSFDTCFPGWYPSRAIHIHFRVHLGSDTYLTSQLFFDDSLVAEIFATHPEYMGFGQPDTTNDTDNVIGDEADQSPYILTTERMPDGAMLASKVITIRDSLSTMLCMT